jgi:hypothetical protein
MCVLTLPAQKPRRVPPSKLIALLVEGVLRLNPDCSHRKLKRICAAVHRATNGSEDGFDVFDGWCRTSDKYKGHAFTHRLWARCHRSPAGLFVVKSFRSLMQREHVSWSLLVEEVDDMWPELPDT